jgi:Rps23 Pro-64 3,4-dihydroxylase Tpa1-like proline 4-hydroxylase
MVMLKPIEHLPVISARERRAQQLLKLIEQLTVRSMTTIEAAHLLNCKSACAQKYLQQLRDEEVIVLERHPESSACSKAVYRLSSNSAKIREFQELIVQPKRNRSSREKLMSLQAQGSILNVTIGEHGQRIYMLADETHHAIRQHNDPVQRDPLVAALFGAAVARVAEGESHNSSGSWM